MPILAKPRKLPKNEDTIVRKLMQGLQANASHKPLKRQAMAARHFNSGNRSKFSHKSLGFRFRRYGK